VTTASKPSWIAGDGVHHAMLGIARLHNLALTG
jgi:hypothetical protein